MTSAETFSDDLAAAATDVESYFNSLVCETFIVSVSPIVTVTTEDDNAGE